MTASLGKKDKSADVLLDFIAGGVPGNEAGESRGNYNAVFSDITASENLAQYSLSEILGPVMDRVLRLGGGRSTATGRYQFLRRTLRGLVNELHLSLDEKFTPELQDRLAVRLLERRGYRQWRAGELNNVKFLHNLALEWASLPDPLNGGKSAYDGDAAGNHASTSLASAYGVLRRASAAIEGEAAGSDIEAARERIAELQRVLQDAGKYHAEIDGRFGPLSRAALSDLLDDAGQRPVT